MKKLLLIHHYGGIGGAGLSLVHIINKIDKSKYKVYLLCPQNSDALIKLLANENCEIITSSTSPKIFAHYNGGIPHAISLKSFKNLYSVFMDMKYIREYIQEVNPDIVAVNSMTLFWIGKICRELDKRSVCFHRETYQKGLFGIRSRIIKNGLSKWFDKVAFISCNDYNESGELKAEKKIIYDRVDSKLFNNFTKKQAKKILGLSEDIKYVLYLGGISELKGSDVIMESMKFIDDESMKLLFVSDINDISKKRLFQFKGLKNKLKYIFKKDIYVKTMDIFFRHSLENKVIFMPITDNPEIYYKACEMVVFPSTKAHQSRPIYEAGIARIPVLITSFKQTEEFAMNESTVITFENRNSKELAEKIKLVFAGHYNLSTILDNNYKQATINHSLESLENDLDEFFGFH